MAILIDLHQVIIANVAQSTYSNRDLVIDKDLIRHMIFNTIRSYASKFKRTYGEVVICCDGFNYWRKKYFPHYKAGRKKDREKYSPLDWTLIHNTINETTADLKEHFPYKVFDLEGCEADDIIAVLINHVLPKDKKHLIISDDHDFTQLLNDNVSIFRSRLNEIIHFQ